MSGLILLGSEIQTGFSDTVVIPSFTSEADDLLICFIGSEGDGSGATTLDTHADGDGWSEASAPIAGFGNYMTAFVCKSAGATAALVVDPNGSNRKSAAVFKLDGADTALTASAAIVQINSAIVSSNTTVGATLSTSFGGAENFTVHAHSRLSNSGGVITPTAEGGHVIALNMSPQERPFFVAYFDGEDNTPTISQSAAFVNFGSISIEVAGAATSAGPTITGPDDLVKGTADAIEGTGFSAATVDLQITGGADNVVSQVISSQSATEINITPRNVVTEPTFGVPQDGLPYTAGVTLAAGSTLASIEVVVVNA